jgi:hypothetical protein
MTCLLLRLTLVLYNFALGYGIRSIQVNQDVLKLDSTRQLLVYADDINVCAGSVHTIKNDTDAS